MGISSTVAYSAASAAGSRLRQGGCACRPRRRAGAASGSGAGSCGGCSFWLLRGLLQRRSARSARRVAFSTARCAHSVAPLRASASARRAEPGDRTGEPLAELREREGGNQVDGNDRRGGGGQQRAGQVERIHQLAGQHQPERAAQPDGAAEQAPGQKRQGRRRGSAVSRTRAEDLRPRRPPVSSERIHFQASRNVSSGNRKAAAPKIWKKQVGEVGARDSRPG